MVTHQETALHCEPESSPFGMLDRPRKEGSQFSPPRNPSFEMPDTTILAGGATNSWSPGTNLARCAMENSTQNVRTQVSDPFRVFAMRPCVGPDQRNCRTTYRVDLGTGGRT
jgi:hypothetical protein